MSRFPAILLSRACLAQSRYPIPYVDTSISQIRIAEIDRNHRPDRASTLERALQNIYPATSADLSQHRNAVHEVILRMKLQFGAMEYFGSRGDGASHVCFKEIAECDMLLGIYAWRYGWQPTPSEPSITEQEFDCAVSKKKK